MEWLDRLNAMEGDIGFYARRLSEESAIEVNADLPLIAASVIKIPIMVSAYRAAREGTLVLDETIAVRRENKMPSCGALTYMRDGLSVSWEDLVTLMIILSDNTATNLLIDRLTIPYVNETMEMLGISGVTLRRKLFDAEQSQQGIENTLTARSVAELLSRICSGSLLGGKWDAHMLETLSNQRLNGKIPFFLHSRGIRVAHKTGEDDGITHDCGIVFAREPFVLCMLGNRTSVPAYERLMQDTALALCEDRGWTRNEKDKI